MQTQTQQVVTNQVTQQVQSSCQWEVEVDWKVRGPVKQDPVFAMEEVILYTPEVKLYEHVVPHTHFQVVDKHLDCVETEIESSCCNSCDHKVTVTIQEEVETLNILRIVQQEVEIPVEVPHFHYEDKQCKDREVHVKVWRDVPIDVVRQLPPIDEGDCAQAVVSYTCSKTNHVVNVQQPQIQNIQVQTPVITQPAPQPTCATCNCAAPTPVCAQSGCCR